MKRWMVLASLFSVLCASMLPAQAAVTFEAAATTPGVVTGDLRVEDYLFSASDGHAITNLRGYGASNGSNYLVMLINGTSEERITMVDGRSFELKSLDLGGWLNFGNATRQLELTGYRTVGAPVVAQLTVAPGIFQTYALDGFSGLSALQLRGTGAACSYYVAIDQMLLSPVPEPAPLLLLLSGLTVLIFSRSGRLPRCAGHSVP